MANWASTSYVIEGSKEDVSKVYQVIDDFMNGRKKPVAETASDSWEGNIVKTLGASDEQMKKYLRGSLSSITISMGRYFASTQKRHGEPPTSMRSYQN